MKYADQGGMKNYLGNQPMVDAPKYWRSGPDAPPTELAYITDAEKDMIMKANLHGSLSQGPNEGPSGIMSLDSQGDYTRDRSPSGPQGGSGSRQDRDRREQHMREILTGQKNIGQTSAVSDRTRRGAVPEYVNTPGGMKYVGSAYKDTGRRGFLSRLFGGSNRYGYSPVRGLKNLRTRGVPGQRGFEYYSDDEEIGETKPGYGGRILGGLMSLLTGIPLVGGAIGTAYDYGKGIFGPKQKDMSEFNRLGLFGVPKGTYDFDPNAPINQSTSVPMARLDRFSKPISRSPMSDPMWNNQIDQQVSGIMANNPSALTYGEVLANQNRAKLTGPNNINASMPNYMNQDFLLSGAGGNTRIQDVANVELNNAQLANINAIGASPQIMGNANNRLNLARDNFTDAYRGSYIPRFSQGGLASLWPR
jgi:hypothetical protein